MFGSLTEVEDDYGNVFIKFPKTYLRKIVTPTRVINQASLQKKPNYYRPAMFWDFTNNKELDYVLIGKHIGSLSDDGTKLESKPDKYPLINKTIVQMRTLAQANGAGYQQLDIHVVDMLQTLFVIEQAVLNSQSKVMGYVNGRYTATDLAGVS